MENRNPAEWTDTDRAFLDAARKLTAEEQQLLIDMIKIIKAQAPDRQRAMQEFAETEAGNYKLRTAEGRAAFLEALQTV